MFLHPFPCRWGLFPSQKATVTISVTDPSFLSTEVQCFPCPIGGVSSSAHPVSLPWCPLRGFPPSSQLYPAPLGLQVSVVCPFRPISSFFSWFKMCLSSCLCGCLYFPWDISGSVIVSEPVLGTKDVSASHKVQPDNFAFGGHFGSVGSFNSGQQEGRKRGRGGGRGGGQRELYREIMKYWVMSTSMFQEGPRN